MNINKEEVWKTVPNYDNYMMSSRGRVKSLNFNRSGKERLLKQSLAKTGYLVFNLCKEGKRKTFQVHVLVVMTFLGHISCGHKLVVDHIDGNRLNNNLSNLQVITNRENCTKDKKGGSSKYVGVYWSKAYNKWQAQISINGKSKRLGRFTNELDASEAYQKKLKEVKAISS